MTGNLLDHDNHYKLIAINLSKKRVSLTRQQINFVGKINQDAIIFFSAEKSEQTQLTFKQNSVEINFNQYV